MATYCQAGDTARVTFPDGSIQDFTDTPISINVEEKNTSEVDVSFNANVGAFSYNAPEGLEIIDFISSGSMKFASTHPTVNAWYSWKLLISDIGNYGESSIFISATTRGWLIDDYYRNKPGMLPRTSINQGWDNNYSDNSGILTIKFFLRRVNLNLIITGNSGSILFNQSFSSNEYSVECLQGCPPNTLDCGDCCLPCSSIFNLLAALRAQLARLK